MKHFWDQELASDKYKTLGVPRTASTEEIRNAYLRLARDHHPDLNPGNHQAESDFKAIQLAYETLVDTTARQKYDLGEPSSMPVVFDEDRQWYPPPTFCWPGNDQDFAIKVSHRSPLGIVQSVLVAASCLVVLTLAGYGIYWMSASSASTAALGPREIFDLLGRVRSDDVAPTAVLEQTPLVATENNRHNPEPYAVDKERLNNTSTHSSLHLDQSVASANFGFDVPSIQNQLLQLDLPYAGLGPSGFSPAGLGPANVSYTEMLESLTAASPDLPGAITTLNTSQPFESTIATASLNSIPMPIVEYRLPRMVSHRSPLDVTQPRTIPDTSVAEKMRQNRLKLIDQNAEFFSSEPRRGFQSVRPAVPPTAFRLPPKRLPSTGVLDPSKGMWDPVSGGLQSTRYYKSPGMSTTPSMPKYPTHGLHSL